MLKKENKFYIIEDGKYHDKRNENTDKKYYGQGWSVEETDDGYLLEYISAGHGGKLCKEVISKEAYTEARSGSITLQALLLKYIKIMAQRLNK